MLLMSAGPDWLSNMANVWFLLLTVENRWTKVISTSSSFLTLVFFGDRWAVEKNPTSLYPPQSSTGLWFFWPHPALWPDAVLWCWAELVSSISIFLSKDRLFHLLLAALESAYNRTHVCSALSLGVNLQQNTRVSSWQPWSQLITEHLCVQLAALESTYNRTHGHSACSLRVGL